MNPNRQSKNQRQEVAVIVDHRGQLQAQFGGPGARQDAEAFLTDTQKGGVRHLKGASVVQGEKALEAIKKGSI